MRYKYGNFVFDEGECVLNSVSRTPQRTANGEVWLQKEVHSCSGEMIPPSNKTTDRARQDWIQGRMRRIELALLQSNVDAGMLNNNGTRSENFLLARVSTSGVKVVGFQYGFAEQSEGLSHRTFSFSVESEYLHAGGPRIFDFKETFSYDGNAGPEYVAVELDSVPPDIQQVRERTVQRITQSGQAIGIGEYPRFPRPAFSNLPPAQRPQATKGPPTRRGRGDILFPISWRYSFLSTQNQLR